MLAGPYAGMVLADLGAEVVKVEPVGTGEMTRGLLSNDPNYSYKGFGAYFLTLNRNKKSVAIDLKSPDFSNPKLMRTIQYLALYNICQLHHTLLFQTLLCICNQYMTFYPKEYLFLLVFDVQVHKHLDLVFETSAANELEYGNLTGKNDAIFYGTDKNEDGYYDDVLCPDGTYASPFPEDGNLPTHCGYTDGNSNNYWDVGEPFVAGGDFERDTVNSDYYSNMKQNRASIRSNFYYTLRNKAEISLSLKNIFGTGYAMGSVGPMYTLENYSNTISLKYTSNRHALRYTLLTQDDNTIPRQNLARFEASNPHYSFEQAVDNFGKDSVQWIMERKALDYFIDYQWNSYLLDNLQIVAGFDYEYKNPDTKRTFITDDGYDYFLREKRGQDITEYRYGIYGQLMTNISKSLDITTSVRYDDHEYYGDMISPRLSLIRNNFFKSSDRTK